MDPAASTMVTKTASEGLQRSVYWDRQVSAIELEGILRDRTHPEHLAFLARLLREGRPNEVWAYTSPKAVAAEWPEIASRLGRRRAFWAWLLAEWRSLGLVSDGTESTLVDIVYEPVEQVVSIDEKPIEDGLRYDALDDLIANKLCAALGRGDVKDLVDLYFLDQADADPLSYLEAARRTDGGMEPLTLAWALHATPADPSRLLLLRPLVAG